CFRECGEPRQRTANPRPVAGVGREIPRATNGEAGASGCKETKAAGQREAAERSYPMLQRTQDLLNTSTVEFKVPSSTNGTRHARNGGNGHARQVRRQIQHGYRHAIRKADLAVTLVGCGMAVTEAVQLLNISSAYFYAMKALRESGDTDLYDAVLKDRTPFFAAAKSVKNAATVITAYAKCSELEKALVLAATGATADA